MKSAMTAEVQDHDIIGVIARSPWFEGLPESALQRLAEGARIRSYRKNSYLFTAGETTHDIFCVLSGRIRLLITSAIGQEFALTDLGPESWLNEAALPTDLPRLIDAQVNETATMLLIQRGVVLEVGEKHPRMFQKLFADHVLRTRGVYTLLTGMAFYPLKSRLAGWLLQLANEHGETTDDGVSLNVNLSQNDLAQLSLGSRQRINKILGEWRERGIIELDGGRYLIRDIDALTKETELRDQDD